MGYVKSPLNYTGGKFKLLDQILPLFPEDIEVFVDLFGGGANVLANADAKYHVYNDLNAPVSGLIHWLYSTATETALAQVDHYIEVYGLNKENRDGYLACRLDYNNEDTKHPSHLYALLTHAFNNQIRFNTKGEYNMPFGTGRSSFNPVLRERFTDFANRLHTLRLVGNATSFDEVIAPPGSFFYCDPPYLITTATYNEKDGWNPEQEEKLLHYLRTLDSYGIKWALSNVTHHQGRTNDLLIAFAGDYVTHELTMSYSHNSYHKKDRDSKSREVLVTNY